MIRGEDFHQVDIRVGKVTDVEEFPEAINPSYTLEIDFGPLGMKKSSAALRPWYKPEDLLGRLVVAVVNLPQKQIATFKSDVLVLGAVQADGRVLLLKPDRPSELGARVA